MSLLSLAPIAPRSRLRRASVLFLSFALLWFVQAQLNHYLAAWRVSVFLGGLFVAFPALHGQSRSGAWSVVVAGFLCDASSPVWNGTHPLLFLAAFLAIRNLRDRLPRDETIVRVLVALATNLALFLAISFIRISEFPDAGAAWGRLIVDLIFSQFAIALIGPWFFALQRRSLIYTRAEASPID